MISILILFLFLNNDLTFAYNGPGMGGGVIAAIFGIIAAFFWALGNTLLSYKES